MKLWAVVDPSGSIVSESIQPTVDGAITMFLASQHRDEHDWSAWSDQGYTCREYWMQTPDDSAVSTMNGTAQQSLE